MHFTISRGGIGFLAGFGQFWGGFFVGPGMLWGRVPLIGAVQRIQGFGWDVERWSEAKRESRGEMLSTLVS